MAAEPQPAERDRAVELDAGPAAAGRQRASHVVPGPVGRGRPDRGAGPRGRRRRPDDPPGRDARPGRRVGVRQVDAWALDPATRRADGRRGLLQRARRPRHGAFRDAPDAPRHGDDLPGSVRLARSPPDSRRHRRRVARHPPADARAASAARPDRRAARPGRPVTAVRGPLPARVLGRPATAHRHRPRPRRRPVLHRLRRAGLRARRVDPGPDHQPAREAAGPAST